METPKLVRILLVYVAEQKRAADGRALQLAKVQGYGQNRAMDKAGRRR